ncbi:hypothetical protein ALP39_00948 [Pseudomonas marginalis pv. marginalis]|nr:hypothetical protein ALP39_00948 [Pseudomonas marginalis pv. marginalis]
MDFSQQEFERRMQEPAYWFNKSADMRASAGAIHYSISHSDAVTEWLDYPKGYSMSVASHDVFVMLCGLSMELIYKAILVSKAIKFDKVHKLNPLRKLAEVDVSELQEGILDLYTHAIYWVGKYPVPLKNEFNTDFMSLVNEHLFENVPGMSINLKRGNGLMSWDTFDTLWRSAEQVYRTPRSI